MLMKTQSRQAKRNYRLMKDPEGPQMKRLDTHISNNSWKMFVCLRDSMNMTQRQVVEFSLKLALLLHTLRGKVSEERLTEFVFEAAAEVAAEAKAKVGAKAKTNKKSSAGRKKAAGGAQLLPELGSSSS